MKKIKTISGKKLKPWKINKPFPVAGRHVLLWLFFALLLAGCAKKPWTEPLRESETDSVSQLVDSLAARDAACGDTLVGDIILFYQNPFEKKALDGFLQFSMPSSYKFVMTNPFGQPVLIIAGDQVSFEAINTLEKEYFKGSLRSFGLRNNIPGYFLKSNWGSLLTGRNKLSSKSITDIRGDRDSRGIWLTFQNKEQKGFNHLLLDRNQEVYPVRILEDGKGKEIAKITYSNWVTMGQCRQPQEINITGLDYGTDIQIKLSDVLITNEKRTYKLSPPPGYFQQYLP